MLNKKTIKLQLKYNSFFFNTYIIMINDQQIIWTKSQYYGINNKLFVLLCNPDYNGYIRSKFKTHF